MNSALLALVVLLACPLFAQENGCALPDAPVAVAHCEPFRIYVTDYGRARIERILSRHFDGFTILRAHGCWKGTCEKSVVIEIAGASEDKVRAAADELRVAGKQQEVIVVAPPRGD